MSSTNSSSKAPAQRSTAAKANDAQPVLLELTMTATKETTGTIRYDTTEEWNKAHGGRGTNIYFPKSAIPAGGLRPTIKVIIQEG